MANLGTNEAWEAIFDKYPEIPDVVERDGFYVLEAKKIKEFREPRLMTKHDSTEGVPKALKGRGLNVLPISRREYVIGDFLTFADFPAVDNNHPISCHLPDFETLDIQHISSESNAINALLIGGILDDFLGEPNTVETYNGRMGSGDFTFSIERKSKSLVDIDVRGAQLEIDGGFENQNSVVIMEAKNVIHSNFQVRQLYYPFRKYLDIVQKKHIRLVFSQYTNLTYHLFEYQFSDPMDYSSLELLQSKSYTFATTKITQEDVWKVWRETSVTTTDDKSKTKIPFVQANKFERIIAICEFLQAYPEGVSKDAVIDFIGMVERQAAYYPSAGEYLGLIDRNGRGTVMLSKLGRSIFSLGYRERQLCLAAQIFKHEIFHTLYEKTILNGSIPSNTEIVSLMLNLNVCNDGATVHRRANSVVSWLRWLLELPDNE